jgi:hypothetical protein
MSRRPITAARAWLGSDTWPATITAVVLTFVLGIVALVLLPAVLAVYELHDRYEAWRAVREPGNGHSVNAGIWKIPGAIIAAIVTGEVLRWWLR